MLNKLPRNLDYNDTDDTVLYTRTLFKLLWPLYILRSRNHQAEPHARTHTKTAGAAKLYNPGIRFQSGLSSARSVLGVLKHVFMGFRRPCASAWKTAPS